MFVAVNTIQVENPAQMVQMFRMQASGMKDLPGFRGLELWTDEKSIKAITRWDDRKAFEGYVNSDVFKKSHGGASGHEMRPKAQLDYYESEILA